MKILGFDVSSTTIGYCFLEISNKQIIYKDSGYIKPIKTGSIIHRLNDTRNKVISILNKYNPDSIAIEDIIQFMAGRSNAISIITLATFNRMIGLTCHLFLNKEPYLYSVNKIRNGIKLVKKSKAPKKEEIPEVVSNLLKIKFPYEYNRKKNLKPENFDRADAIAVALYHAIQVNK